VQKLFPKITIGVAEVKRKTHEINIFPDGCLEGKGALFERDNISQVNMYIQVCTIYAEGILRT
jgi:hypothetical protein